MDKKCPKCGEMVEGVDLGDNGTFLNFDCECGHSWGEDCSDEFADMAEYYNDMRNDR